MHTSGDFKLHGGDTAFANRQKLLFDKLSDAEQECNKNKMDIESRNVDIHTYELDKSHILRIGQKSVMRKFRGRESIFKRPEGPAPRAVNRRIPDFRMNPHKWKQYSLDDVSNNDMSEESNTRAALSFLKELKARRLMEKAKESEKMDIDQSESEEKIIFKWKKNTTCTEIKFKKLENNAESVDNDSVVENDEKPIYRNSIIIMPEYVIGQKLKKKNKKGKSLVKVDRLKQLKLNHLEEPDEED